MEPKLSNFIHWPPRPFESFVKVIPEHLRNATIGGMTAVTTLASSADFYIHEPNGLSEPARRAIVSKFIGPEITSHLGNTFISLIIMSAFMYGGELLRSIGEKHDQEWIKKTAELTPLLGLLFVSGINFAETNLTNQPNPQGFGDMAFGITAAFFTGTILSHQFENIWHRATSGLNSVELIHETSNNFDRANS